MLDQSIQVATQSLTTILYWIILHRNVTAVVGGPLPASQHADHKSADVSHLNKYLSNVHIVDYP